MSADPKWLRMMGWSEWQRDECKHCGLEIRSKTGENWSHAEGPQRALNRCAVEPYGYDAAPVWQPCSFACLGSSSTGIEGGSVSILGEKERDRVWVDREGWRFEWSPDPVLSSGGWWQVFRPGGSLADETTVPPDDGPFWPVGLVDSR